MTVGKKVQNSSTAIRILQTRLTEAETYLQLNDLRIRRSELEAEISRPDLWEQPESARTMTTELAAINEDIAVYENLASGISDIKLLNDLAIEEADVETSNEVTTMIVDLSIRFDRLELRTLFSGEFDKHDAVCQLKAGEGGTDSQDWAQMMLRMYRHWAESHDFELETIAISAGTEAGCSSVDFLIKGHYAYGWLRSEHGVHRLVRISPFNSGGKRQTSFTALEVAPFFEDTDIDIIVNEKELRIDTYRSSGAGGQHVNVTDSAVRITHLPTGITISCQNERSQHQNKERALQMLKSKLADLERRKRTDKLAEIKGEQHNVGFGSQIRSYVMHPYQMVKDLRTGYSTSDIRSVLDGNLDTFMESWMRHNRNTNRSNASV